MYAMKRAGLILILVFIFILVYIAIQLRVYVYCIVIVTENRGRCCVALFLRALQQTQNPGLFPLPMMVGVSTTRYVLVWGGQSAREVNGTGVERSYN